MVVCKKVLQLTIISAPFSLGLANGFESENYPKHLRSNSKAALLLVVYSALLVEGEPAQSFRG